MFEEQRIIFTCSQVKLINNKKSNEMKKYRNEIDLFGKVKPAVSSKGQVHCGRSISGKLERRLNVHGLCEGTHERSLSRDRSL